jgi:hypothetical protein
LIGELTQHVFHDLLRRLRAHGLAADMAVLLADTCVEHAQVVVDLGDRADGRARIGRRALLLDGDRGRETANALDGRSVELTQELTRVGAQALDVAALALRVERVERQARLARAAHAGEDHQLPLWQHQALDLEVVGAGADDLDLFEQGFALHGSGTFGGRPSHQGQDA